MAIDWDMLDGDATEGDWEAAFRYAEGFTQDDVFDVLGAASEIGSFAEIEVWIWGVLKDKRYFFLVAGCDTTGWGCQAGGWSGMANNQDGLIHMIMDEDARAALDLKDI